MHCDLIMLSEAVFQIPKIVFTRGVFRCFVVVLWKGTQKSISRNTKSFSRIFFIPAEQSTEHPIPASTQKSRRAKTSLFRNPSPKTPCKCPSTHGGIGINYQPHLLFVFVAACGVCIVCLAVRWLNRCCWLLPHAHTRVLSSLWGAWGASSLCEFW